MFDLWSRVYGCKGRKFETRKLRRMKPGSYFLTGYEPTVEKPIVYSPESRTSTMVSLPKCLRLKLNDIKAFQHGLEYELKIDVDGITEWHRTLRLNKMPDLSQLSTA